MPSNFLTINLYSKDDTSFKSTNSNVDVLLKDVMRKVQLIDKEDTGEGQLILSQHDTNALTDFTRQFKVSARVSNELQPKLHLIS